MDGLPMQEFQNGTNLHIPPVGCWKWMLPHFIMGLVAVAMGLWWAGNVFGQFFDSHTGNRQFRSQLFYLSTNRALPVEPWCFVLFPGILALVFAVFAVMKSEMAAVHHMGFLIPFVFLGLVELMIHRQMTLPENLDAAMFVIAFFLKGFMSFMHLAGLPPLTAKGHLHTILIDCCIVLVTLLEHRHRGSVVCALARPYLVLVEGTWLMQIAFIQSECSFVTWDFNDSHLVMLQAASFTWHHMVHCWTIALIGCCVWRYKRSGHTNVWYQKLPHNLLEVNVA